MADEQGQKRPDVGVLQATVAIALIVMFIVALIVLGFMRDAEHWDRLVYLLGGFEAVVFAGVGALFGTSVQRANAAQKEADEAKARADENEKDAKNGAILAAAVQSHAAAQTGVRLGAREEDAGEPEPGSLADLAAYARRLFPDV
ncbi:hypothetical protein J5X84_41735 [Streptosporangiaceae bacterium NEAU-GS5]|nr:hypothetical protein [Streptosporangiaceae bacterium NEAU-GS5]